MKSASKLNSEARVRVGPASLQKSLPLAFVLFYISVELYTFPSQTFPGQVGSGAPLLSAVFLGKIIPGEHLSW